MFPFWFFLSISCLETSLIQIRVYRIIEEREEGGKEKKEKGKREKKRIRERKRMNYHLHGSMSCGFPKKAFKKFSSAC